MWRRARAALSSSAPERAARDIGWVPTLVLLVGLGATLILVATWQVRVNRMLRNLAQVQAVGGIETRIATSHLWLEELVSGDDVELAWILDDLDGAEQRVEALLGSAPAGGAAGTSIRVELSEPELVKRALAVRAEIASFRRISTERLQGFERGADVGIGSAMDREYDATFLSLLAGAEQLEAALSARRDRDLATSRLTFTIGVVAWLGMIALSVYGLQRYERRRRDAVRALRESERRRQQGETMQAVGRLAGGIAHDINNYLAAITSQAELVKMRAEPGSKVATKMETVVTTAFRASNLLERLLAFAKRQPGQTQVIDLNGLIVGLEPMMLRLLEEDIDLQLELDPELGWVRVDPSQVEQVIVNLLVNARDAMASGGVLEIATHNAERGGREEVRVSVRDEGQGIAPAALPKIFEPFFTTKQDAQGSGLGLATVYGIIEQNGGWIEVESRVGVGSDFTFGLPRTFEEPNPERAEPAATPASAGGDETVLYVEDNDDLRRSVTALLEGLGYRVLAAADGPSALALFEDLRETESVDLLVSDVVMPLMSGGEVMQRIRERSPRTRILFVSGYTDGVMLAHGVDDGEYELLRKPFGTGVLARKIREVLDQSSPVS